jgi:hypothetical protein
MKLQYAYPPTSNTSDQSITWQFKKLAPGESGIITLNLLLPLDAALINSTMKLKAVISNGSFDEVGSNNEVLLERIVK